MPRAPLAAALAAIPAAVQSALDAHVPAGATVAIALSGGRDSVVLFDALVRAAPAGGHRVLALHVHHGLSPHADAWQRFCVELCAERNVPLAVCAVAVSRAPQTSLESEARRERYAALIRMAGAAGAQFIVLAHHRDDQAETLLLQLLRGAGPHGLAAMSAVRTDHARAVAFLRPMLGIARAAIDDYADAAQLRWVDDESNAQTRHLRNAVRHVLMPALAGVFPDPQATLARAAAHQAEAGLLADDLAAHDARAAGDGATLDRAALAALPAHRARNLLRWFLRQQGLPAPSSARLAAMLAQLASARGDAQVCLVHGGAELGVHRGRIAVHAKHAPAFDLPWHGEPELVLPHGRLGFVRAEGEGLAALRLSEAPVRVRSRAGGERLQLAPNRPRRALKSILQDAAIPAWERQALPLVFCGDTLAAAAGVGIDAAFRAAPGTEGITLVWQPDAR